MSEYKDKLRARAFAGSDRYVKVTTSIGDLFVRKPTMAMVDHLHKMHGRKPAATLAEISMYMICESVRDPDTDEAVFEKTDSELFKASEFGGWVNEVTRAINGMLNGVQQACECGVPLAPPFKFCPSCGKEQPTAQEAAEKN